MRVYALSLTRDRDAADDLVHDTVVKALTGRASFEPGTNLSAWVFRIQRNEFISGLRRLRPSVPVDSAVAESLSHQPHQESRLVMREFMSAFGKLAPTQREALLLAVLEGQSYEVIAAHTGANPPRCTGTGAIVLLSSGTTGTPKGAPRSTTPTRRATTSRRANTRSWSRRTAWRRARA